MKENLIIEDSVLFTDKEFFGDEHEHEYFCRCYDGHAICMSSVYSDAPDVIKVGYPKLSELNDIQKKYILEFRGLFDKSVGDVHYGDVMFAYGTIYEGTKINK